jgi:hypothetical protein
MPRKVFTAGEVLAAADVNEFLQDQAVMSFAGTAARGSAIGAAVEGMVTYLNDSNSLSVNNGTDWTIDRTIQVFAGTAARGSAIPSPVEGMYSHINATDSLEYYNGSAWSNVGGGTWTSFTPNFTAVTVGNGTVSASYVKIGKTVIGYVQFTLGSTSSIATNARFNLPTTSKIQWINPKVTFIDLGVVFVGEAFMDSNELYLLAVNTAGTYASAQVVTATVPFTWTTGDDFSVTFIYEEV